MYIVDIDKLKEAEGGRKKCGIKCISGAAGKSISLQLARLLIAIRVSLSLYPNSLSLCHAEFNGSDEKCTRIQYYTREGVSKISLDELKMTSSISL